MIPDISCEIAGVKFKNPVIAASGTFGFGEAYADIFDAGILGGICTKGLTLNPKSGNTGMRLHETPQGLLNSIGMENPGVEKFIGEKLPSMLKIGSVIIANLGGNSIADYVQGAILLDNTDICMIELNISCPNVKEGGMLFGLDPKCASDVTAAVRKATTKPLIVKLSPNAPDLISVAIECVKAGADALSLVNTFKAMAIDIEKRKMVFDNITAGLSGPSIRPIALRMVYEVAHAVSVPVIGIGGIDSVEAAIEFLCAGACAVEVGSATFANPYTMAEIINSLSSYMKSRNIMTIKEFAV
ncbi:MAG: dihydroorotate dehydrogenase [Termitinemataceae bacterium]|nr:MAG: dihydroorotate dehydrogenase [Termitinemataceae bacterium]